MNFSRYWAILQRNLMLYVSSKISMLMFAECLIFEISCTVCIPWKIVGWYYTSDDKTEIYICITLKVLIFASINFRENLFSREFII